MNTEKIAARFSSRNQSPFARFGLLRNPFGELTVAERAELAVVDSEKYLAWLEQSSRAVLQVIGSCGHGKSTHLRALQYAWAERHALVELPAFVYFPEEGDQPALPRSRPLFIDEAQRMGWWRRRQMLAGSGPLVIGSHRDLSRELNRAGWQTMTIDLDQPMPTARLQELLNRRIKASRSAAIAHHSSDESRRPVNFSELELPLLSVAQVVALQQRFGSNVRQIEHHLYERFQSFALEAQPWLPAD